jgi:hypothetical protein
MPSVRYQPIERLWGSDDVTVYRCFDTLRERPVELHVAPNLPVAMARVDIVSRSQGLARMDCDALRPIYEHGFHDGRPFLVMPVLSGRALGELSLIKGGSMLSGELMIDGMGATSVASAALQVAIALEALHRLGQVHGGLSVASIRVDHSGRVVLSDFGLLRACASTVNDPLAMAEDIRQLGVVMMSLTLGGDLSEPGDEAELRRMLDTLIDRMMSPNPSVRPTADRLVDQLEHALESLPAVLQPWMPSQRAVAAPRRRRTTRLPAFLAALAEDPDETIVVRDSELPPSLLGTFINTISVCSARWQVGKSHPELTQLVVRQGWGRAHSTRPPRSMRPLLLAALLLTVGVGWHFDAQVREAGAEPPERALAMAVGLVASSIPPTLVPAIEPIDVEDVEIDLDVEQPLTASVFALRPGRAPRVVHYRNGEAVGHVARNPYERKMIPPRAYPVAALGALRMVRSD